MAIILALIKLQQILKVGAKCGKMLQAANIGLCPGIETLRPLSYSSVGKLSKLLNVVFLIEHALYFRLRHRRVRVWVVGQRGLR